jgi:hypothetical protein
VLSDALYRWGLPFLTERGLINVAFDLMEILEIFPIHRYTAQEMLLRNGVSCGKFLGNGFEVHWPVGEARGISINVIGDFLFRIDNYCPDEFFVRAIEAVHIHRNFSSSYYVNSLTTARFSQPFVWRNESLLKCLRNF